MRGSDMSFGFIEKTTSYRTEKNVFTLHILRAPHAYDFVVLTSLTHPRKILLVVLQNRKSQRLLSTPTHVTDNNGAPSFS
jgi:hypothetical protein